MVQKWCHNTTKSNCNPNLCFSLARFLTNKYHKNGGPHEITILYENKSCFNSTCPD